MGFMYNNVITMVRVRSIHIRFFFVIHKYFIVNAKINASVSGKDQEKVLINFFLILSRLLVIIVIQNIFNREFDDNKKSR